jgi:sugar phosphate isomerase/epimerase
MDQTIVGEDAAMNPIGLEYLTIYGCHPLDTISMAADLGYSNVSFFTHSLDFAGMPPAPPSLFDDAKLRKEVLACLDDRGLSIPLIDGFGFNERASDRDRRAQLDIVCELGVPRVNTSSTLGWSETIDKIGMLADLADDYGLMLTIEAIPTYTIGDLPSALAVIEQVNRSNLKLLIDTMHIARTGGAELLARIDPDLIGYCQICDGPAGMPAGEVYFDQALHERGIPGQGELPLVEMMACIPENIVASAEVPMRSLRTAGVSHAEIARRVFEGTRSVLEAAAARRIAA